MRLSLSLLVAAGVLTGQMAAAQCLQPADRQALDVAGLKTRLVVTALSCQADAQYNAFVTKYRPQLVVEDRALNSYFTRVHGRAGTKQRDDYVTQLANSESQMGQRQGGLFCSHNLPVFEEVMSLRSATELPAYAGAKQVAQPIPAVACTGTERPTPTRPTRRRT